MTADGDESTAREGICHSIEDVLRLAEVKDVEELSSHVDERIELDGWASLREGDDRVALEVGVRDRAVILEFPFDIQEIWVYADELEGEIIEGWDADARADDAERYARTSRRS